MQQAGIVWVQEQAWYCVGEDDPLGIVQMSKHW